MPDFDVTRALGRKPALLLAGTFVLGASIGGARATHTGAVSSGPPIRVSLAVGTDTSLVLDSEDGLRVVDAQSDEVLFDAPPSRRLRIARSGERLKATVDGRPVASGAYAIRAEPAGTAPVRLGGSPYRGVVEVFAVEDDRLNAVNELPLEDYLLGVVPIEIGAREDDELAAVAAQAVAARTYAVAHLRARSDMGFDVFGTVEDQAYGGMAVEREEATRAVRETAGRILAYDGLPIRAMYHSTCGGRTAAVEEVLDRPGAPYLRPVSDRAPDGTDYCAISPRYRWVEHLAPQDLNGRIRRQMERIFGADGEETGEMLGLRILARTETGRVEALAIRGRRSEFVLERLDIRIALQNEAGRILGSTNFDLRIRRDEVIEIHGRGYGHGSGMCQWGAIGRARAGQTWESILKTYYFGAELITVY